MSVYKKNSHTRRQQHDADALAQAKVQAILRRDVTGETLSTLRHEAGAPALNPRRAQDNPYRLAPLMAEEIQEGRETPVDYPMATRSSDGDEADDQVRAIERYCRTGVWVTLASFSIILLALLLASLSILGIWP